MIPSSLKTVAIVGGGPAGLMAAERLSAAGFSVDVYDAMPSVGRKFLRAGVGGLNLTHSEPCTQFIERYGDRAEIIAHWLTKFDAQALRDWAQGLGVDTFVGSSGRVFPVHKKAAPLLRAWLARLHQQGVSIHIKHRWQGWDDSGALCFETHDGTQLVSADIVVFALGGASWSRFGSDGRWASPFAQRGIHCIDFEPSNCGFEYPWSEALVAAQAGSPLKGVALALAQNWYKRGDAVISRYGVEGSLVYAASLEIRERIKRDGECTVYWDLHPDKSLEQLTTALAKRKKKDSTANVLRKQLGLSGAKLALLKALTDKAQMQDLQGLPALVKRLPQRLVKARPIDEAISTDGGVCFSELSEGLMLHRLPNVYCIGEMLDWETVTGGYLLTACFASAVQASDAILSEMAG
ncbi:MAG: TIGR03862 family flavoprotein [Pseudomonadales bacterium]